MKIAVALASMVLGVSTAFAPTPSNAQSVEVAPLTVPEGATLVEMFRWYNPNTTDRYSGRELPQNWQLLGWRLEGTVGFISYTPFPGSHPLYSCATNEKVPDYFSSVDANCEGQLKVYWAPIIGYLASTQIPGTVPLYRCDTPGYEEDHFDTTSPVCEGNKPGAVNEGPLGYIFF